MFWTTIATSDTTCCELVAFFELVLYLNTTCLTLFKLIFVNEVKHVKCGTCFGRQLPQGHDRLWISCIFWIVLYLEHQPGAEAREALASDGGLARQSRTCLTLFSLIFVNEVKHANRRKTSPTPEGSEADFGRRLPQGHDELSIGYPLWARDSGCDQPSIGGWVAFFVNEVKHANRRKTSPTPEGSEADFGRRLPQGHDELSIGYPLWARDSGCDQPSIGGWVAFFEKVPCDAERHTPQPPPRV